LVRENQPLQVPDLVPDNPSQHLDEDGFEFELVAEDVDPASAARAVSRPYLVSHHIVYSATYSLPVLYFNVRTAEGVLVALEHYLLLLPAISRGAFATPIDHSFISQDEHPILGVPFLHVHPCQVASLMANFDLSRPGEGYIKSWLSVVGSPAGLSMKPEWFLPARPTNS